MRRENTSVSVIIPAYNEEDSLADTLEGAVRLLQNACADYEIIIVDDGSRDKSGMIADELALKNKNISVIHHKDNLGFGQTIRDGIQAAKNEYITGLPGDNDTSPGLIGDLIKNREKADIIIAYMANPADRSGIRRLYSHIFVSIMNVIFGMKLKYYNSYFICKTERLKKLPLVSKGFTIFAEAKVRLIKNGASYKEIPFKHIPRKHGRSTAVSLSSTLNSLQTLSVLIYDIYLR